MAIYPVFDDEYSMTATRPRQWRWIAGVGIVVPCLCISSSSSQTFAWDKGSMIVMHGMVIEACAEFAMRR